MLKRLHLTLLSNVGKETPPLAEATDDNLKTLFRSHMKLGPKKSSDFL